MSSQPPAFTLWNFAELYSQERLLGFPFAAVRSDGTVLFLVNVLVNGNAVLKYAVGSLDAGQQQVVWPTTWGLTPFISTDGDHFSVAMNDEGQVVICWSSESSLSYALCILSAAGILVPMNIVTNYDTGMAPAVAINNAGTVFELHVSDDDNQQRGYYHCGTVQGAIITNFAQQGTGLFTTGNPMATVTAALNDASQIIVGYVSALAQNEMGLFATGTIDNDEASINPFASLGFAFSEAMALDDNGNVLGVEAPEFGDNFVYQTGCLNDQNGITFNSQGTGWSATEVSASLSLKNGCVVIATLDDGAPDNFMRIAGGVWNG